MKHNPNKFTMLLKKAYKILNKASGPVLRDDFSLYDLCWSAGRLKNGEPNNTYQAIPCTATPGWRTCCLTEHQDHAQHWLPEIVGIIPYREMIYTGPIDEFFDYRYGKLPYRSVGSSMKRSTRPCINQWQSWLSQWAFVYPQRSSNTWPDKNT